MPDQLTELYRRAIIASSAPSISEETHADLEDLWEEVHSGVDVTDDEAFGPFLAEFIRDRHAETPPEKAPMRLCRSGNALCNTLHGKVPTKLQADGGRFSDDSLTLASARVYVSEHPQCIVVADAMDAFEAERTATKQTLQKIIRTSRAGGAGSRLSTDRVPGGGATS